jgi:cystathionine gamma-synthase
MTGGPVDPARRAHYDGGAFRTRAVPAGQYPEQHAGALSVPVHFSSTFERSVVLDGGWDYSRIANPTRTTLEQCLTSLEGGAGATVTASGMAATTTTVLATCAAGAHVVLPDSTYGGTWDLFTEVLSRWGLTWTVVDMADLDAVAAAVTDRTALVWVETPSNPTAGCWCRWSPPSSATGTTRGTGRRCTSTDPPGHPRRCHGAGPRRGRRE